MKVWQWGVDFVTTVIGSFLGSSFQTGAYLFGTYVLMTPLMIEFEWMKTPWVVAVALAIIISIIFVLVGIFKMYFKNDADIDWNKTFKIVIVAIFLSTATVFVVDFFSFTWNMTANQLIKPVLIREYKTQANESFIAKEDLEDHEIDFDAFDPSALLLLSYGAGRGIPEPETPVGGGSLSEQLDEYTNSGDEDIPVYEYFLIRNGGDGSLTMVLAMILAYLMGLLGIFRVAVLMVLAIGGPLWMAFVIYSTSWDTLKVYFYMVNLTIAIGYIFEFAWFINVMISRSGLPFGIQTIALLIYLAAMAFTILVWMRACMWAVREPITLGAATFAKHYGGAALKLGDSLSDMGQFFGFEKVQKAGDEMSIHGSAMDKLSDDLMNQNVNDGIRNHMDVLHNHERYQYYEEASRKQAFLGTSFGAQMEKSNYTGVVALGMNTYEFADLLEREGLADVIDIDGEDVFIKDEYLEEAQQILKNAYMDNNLMEVAYDGAPGHIVVNDEVLDNIIENAEQEEIDLMNVVHIQVDPGGQLKEMRSNMKNYAPLDKDDNLVNMPGGLIGANFEDKKRYENMKGVFKAFGVEYTDNKDQSMFINEAQYKALDEKFNTLHALKELGVDSGFEALYNADTEEVYEVDRIKELLHSLDVGFEDINTIFIDDEDVEDTIESLLNTIDEELEVKEQRRYMALKMETEHAYDDLKRELYTQLPAGSILTETSKSRKRKEIMIDQAYVEEAMKTVKAYDKRQPYWLAEDGMYITKRKGGFILYETDPPEDGRFMGFAPVSIKGGIAH